MTNYELKNVNLSYKLANSSYLLTGCARSGTSIFGSILGSMQNTEYLFESPALLALFTKINKMKEVDWMFFFESYLFEEFYINSLAGRIINTNRYDDSSIYNFKSTNEVKKRLGKSYSRIEIIKNNNINKVIFKNPDILLNCQKVLKYYPKMKLLITKRNVFEIINSLTRKKWFEQKNLNKGVIWPFKIYKNTKIPYFINNNEFDFWLSLDQVNKAAFYVLKIKGAEKKIPNSSVVYLDYDNLLDNKVDYISNISNKLNMKMTKKTFEIIKSIKKRDHNTEIKKKRISKELLVKINEL